MSHRPWPRPTAAATHVVALAAALLVALGLALPADPAQALSRGDTTKPTTATFGVQPAFAGRPDARPFFRFGTTPDALVNDQLALRNYATRPVTLRLVASDATNLPDGGLTALPTGTASHDAGSWVALGGAARSGQVTVPGRSTVVVPFRLRVPHDATPGDHVAGLLASLVTTTRDAQGTDVRLDQRVGTRLFVRVSGPLRPSLQVSGVTATWHGSSWNPFARGTVTLRYRLQNAGNVALGASATGSVHGLVGPTTRARAAGAALLLPGNGVDASVEVRGVRPVLRERATVRVTPLVVSGDVVSVRGISRSVVLWVVPWLLVGLLALLLVALFVLLVRRRRRRTGQRRRAAQPATPAGRARHREPAGRVARNASRPGRVLPGAARSLAVAGLLTAAGVVLVPPAPASASSTVPYRDVASSGRITLCSNGKPVTTGRVGSDPFVTTAVGESAATEGYGGDGRTAVLSAYQPRQGVSPGEWSGMQLTASTLYARAAHPTARFTRGDYRLSDFLEAYPAGWQGRVQLRLLLRAPDQPTSTYRYDSLDLQVRDGSWQVVGAAGGASCDSGASRSVADVLGLNQQASGKPGAGTAAPSGTRTRAAATPLSRPTAGAPTPAPTGLPGSATPADGADDATARAEAVRSTAASSTAVSPWWWLAVPVLGTGVALALARRGRSRG
ncbi:hypothetical protein [Angustibacter aerolatus]